MKKIIIISLLVLFLIPLVNSQSNCIESWVCQDYSPCINNIQTRTCVDVNKCNTFTYQPRTEKSCNTNDIRSGNITIDKSFDLVLLIWILIPILFLLLILFVFFKIIKHKKSPYKALNKKDNKKDTLEAYIKQSLVDGSSESDIIKNLVSVGWPEARVKSTVSKLTPKKISPSTPKSQLESSIEKALKQGFSKKQVREILINKKWPPSKIDPILDKF